jgi:cation diffusion facilitator CzcD-associated flavoprotein CzcO
LETPVPQLPTACIIGAGPCGLTTAKALRERGLPFDCFELADEVGGVWYYKSPTGNSAAYRDLHINTSKTRMQFSDYPMPAEWPNFCHHSLVFEYFKGYCDHFDLRRHITFNTGVEHATRGDDGVWTLRLSNGETRRYDALFVCNGHHWDPQWPEPPFPGHFNGRVIHSHDFKGDEDFRGKRVVVLGIGNSALDIAVDLSYLADRVFLSTRRGAHIIPKYILGRPLDAWVVPGVPLPLAQAFLRLLLALHVGSYEKFGLPKPAHGLLASHPAISSAVLDRLAHRDIVPKPNIAALDGDRVRFVDGSEEPADLVIYCTGYKVSFPFFDPGFLQAPGNDLPLYLRMFHPDLPNLFFIGLFQPLGAIFPIAEVQARLAAEYLAGRCHLPAPDAMRVRMAREQAAMRARYYESRRHTMQVDFHPFLSELRRELRHGARRAAAAGNALPVPPRAQAPAALPGGG